MKTKNKINKNIIHKIMKLIFGYNKTYPIVLFIIAIIKSILPFFSLINTQNIINGIQKKNSIDEILMFIVMFVILNVSILLFNSAYGYFFAKYNQLLYLKINQDILNKTNELTYVDFENSKVYDLLQRAEMEAGVRPINIFNSILSIISSGITIISSLFILLSWKWWTVLGFILLPIFAFKYYKIIGNLEYDIVFNRTKYERKSWYISHLLTKDTSIKEIKMLNLFPYLMDNFNDLRNSFFKENIRVLRKKSLFQFIYQLANISFMCFVVIIGMIEATSKQLMVGTLMTYINTTSKVDSAIGSISNSIFSIYQDSLYAENIITFLDLPCDKNTRNVLLESLIEINSIEFKNVSFKYPNQSNYVLKDINFKINKGESVAIVGENGSGKSTLIKILCGLYTDYEGQILINDINLRNISEIDYKRLISIVFQDFNNYQFTVKDNIGFGNINQLNNENMIIKAAENANANDFINMLPKRFNQQVGNWFENGIQLSGGQWQKLALSRAFMKDADIYILDEPTASLDPLSEYHFFNSFINKSNDKMSIIITHRFSNAKIADQIIMLEKGKIICRGNHDELIKNNLIYKKMCKLSNIIERNEKNEENTIFYS